MLVLLIIIIIISTQSQKERFYQHFSKWNIVRKWPGKFKLRVDHIFEKRFSIVQTEICIWEFTHSWVRVKANAWKLKRRPLENRYHKCLKYPYEKKCLFCHSYLGHRTKYRNSSFVWCKTDFACLCNLNFSTGMAMFSGTSLFGRTRMSFSFFISICKLCKHLSWFHPPWIGASHVTLKWLPGIFLKV